MIGKLKFMIYFKDHGHPHVHVIGPGAEAKVLIENQAVINHKGFTAKELKLVQKAVAEYKEELMEAWEDANN